MSTEGFGGWVKNMKGLRKKQNNLIDTDNSIMITREKGNWEEVKVGVGGWFGKGDLTLGLWHKIQYTGDAL